jgi:tRNA(fMet)-specific endonuclease VapC
VAASLILETTFLIDLEREAARGKPGKAHAFLELHADDALHLTFTIAGELACGASMQARDRWERFVGPFQILQSSDDVCWAYGVTYRFLQDNGLMIGANDLWIAATALAHRMPLVTRNLKHFKRVPGLDVLPYA